MSSSEPPKRDYDYEVIFNNTGTYNVYMNTFSGIDMMEKDSSFFHSIENELINKYNFLKNKYTYCEVVTPTSTTPDGIPKKKEELKVYLKTLPYPDYKSFNDIKSFIINIILFSFTTPEIAISLDDFHRIQREGEAIFKSSSPSRVSPSGSMRQRKDYKRGIGFNINILPYNPYEHITGFKPFATIGGKKTKELTRKIKIDMNKKKYIKYNNTTYYITGKPKVKKIGNVKINLIY
jgi:hypothetical protein